MLFFRITITDTWFCKNIFLRLECIDCTQMNLSMCHNYLSIYLSNISLLFKGGLMSCKAVSGLDGELKSWVEGAEHGVIYLSFGSVVKASEMPEERWVDWFGF